MERVNGVTSADLALWKRADRTLFGLLLDDHAGARETCDDGGAFVCILPKGTPLAQVYASDLEGHYQCICGVNYVELPAKAVQDKRPRHSTSEARATIRERRLSRAK